MRCLPLAAAMLCVPWLGGMAAARADQNGIAVAQVWSRPAMAGRTGIVYLTVTDNGAPDRLTGASTPVAAKATLHQSIDDHGVMKMRAVAALPVQPGQTLTLAPDGYHVMLEGLKQALLPGQTFPITLTFEKAGAVTATATVQKAGGMDHAGMGGAGMSGSAKPAGNGMPGMTMGGMKQH